MQFGVFCAWTAGSGTNSAAPDLARCMSTDQQAGASFSHVPDAVPVAPTTLCYSADDDDGPDGRTSQCNKASGVIHGAISSSCIRATGWPTRCGRPLASPGNPWWVPFQLRFLLMHQLLMNCEPAIIGWSLYAAPVQLAMLKRVRLVAYFLSCTGVC